MNIPKLINNTLKRDGLFRLPGLAVLIPLLLLWGSFTLLSANVAAKTPQPKLATAIIEINGVRLETEIASTAQQRQRGLSYRKRLDAESGMLFVYQNERKLTFTMRETAIPLSIAFVSQDFVINEIHKMEPFNKEFYPSRHPAKYALEVNQGWFEQKQIKPGDRIKLVFE